MTNPDTIHGVLLSETFDLKTFYQLDLSGRCDDVRLLNPDEVSDPAAIRFAVCWQPGEQAFAPYPELEMAMSIGAGVDDLVTHDGLPPAVEICRVRDPYQAELMAGFVAHEVLRIERDFEEYAQAQVRAQWNPLPMRPPEQVKIAILGNGFMGRAIARAMIVLGFSVTLACRSEPDKQIDGAGYCWGEDAMLNAASDAAFLVNALPLTDQTRGVLNAELFAKLSAGATLIQIGRGEHLNEEDLVEALDKQQLSGASLDVFATEPLPEDHPFWSDNRIHITPHIASDTTPHIVSEQVVQSARELLAGKDLSLAIDREQGY
ncbi:NAD(P)-dependent oxidoreductase [Croceicoccus mobilis]|uniref:Glyoxylate/hydroxypyruvate reductase A n=1 Tax=Croceicoccus mobilis TaxID=1703339 RepID=A0A917DTP4_9SPHN|nr:NAD(P)-dependent oxidoreductase [Croceicoccus mobilis]GGD65678.1 glyoxylate/hydroxypyruvate reductase A [Croceicoccus mobilis]